MSRLPTYLALPVTGATLASLYFGVEAQPLWLLVPPALAIGACAIFYSREQSTKQAISSAVLAALVMALWAFVLSAILYGIGAVLDSLSAG